MNVLKVVKEKRVTARNLDDGNKESAMEVSDDNTDFAARLEICHRVLCYEI